MILLTKEDDRLCLNYFEQDQSKIEKFKKKALESIPKDERVLSLVTEKKPFYALEKETIHATFTNISLSTWCKPYCNKLGPSMINNSDKEELLDSYIASSKETYFSREVKKVKTTSFDYDPDILFRKDNIKNILIPEDYEVTPSREETHLISNILNVPSALYYLNKLLTDPTFIIPKEYNFLYDYFNFVSQRHTFIPDFIIDSLTSKLNHNAKVLTRLKK